MKHGTDTVSVSKNRAFQAFSADRHKLNSPVKTKVTL